MFEKSSKFWAPSHKNTSNSPISSADGLYGHKPYSFPPNRGLQKCGKVNNCSLDYGSWVEYLKNSNFPQSKSTLADFSSNKMRQPIGRKDSIQAVSQRMRRLEALLYLAPNFELFSKFKIKIKIIKNLKRLLSFSRPIPWYHYHVVSEH